MEPKLSMNPKLYEAAKSGNVDGLKQILCEPGELSHEVTPQKNTAVHVAVRFGRKNFVEEMCKRCPALLTQANREGNTPLHIAAKFGDRDIVDFLISQIKSTSMSSNDTENGISESFEKIRLGNKDNYTPLHEAVRNGHLQVVKLLTDADPELSLFDDNAKPSLLYLAARTGSIPIVKLILQNPTASALGGPDGQTALHVAAASRHSDIVEALLEKKPQLVKGADNHGRTPLHYAAHFGNRKVIKKLLGENKSSAYRYDKDGRSPLHVAAFNGHIGVLGALASDCPDCVELLSSDGRSALHLAVMSGKIITVNYALDVMELDEFINMGDNDGNTPLHLAVKHVKPLIFFYLSLHSKAQKWARNKNGQTAFDIHDDLSAEFSSTVFLKIWSLLITFIGWHGQKRDIREQIMTAKKKEEDSRKIQLYKEMGSTLATVATLIATVTFASALQVPGGFLSGDSSKQGVAALSEDPSFQDFMIADTIAMSLSITAMFLILFGTYFTNKKCIYFLEIARALTYIAFLATGVAFMAGVAAVLPVGYLKNVVTGANGIAVFAPYIFAVIGFFIFTLPLMVASIVYHYQMTPFPVRKFVMYYIYDLMMYY